MRVSYYVGQAIASAQAVSSTARLPSPRLQAVKDDGVGEQKVQASLPAGATAGDRTAQVSDLVQDERRASGTRLSVDDATKRLVAEIVDQNNEVIRQIPPQELLDVVARFNRLQGMLFDERV